LGLGLLLVAACAARRPPPPPAPADGGRTRVIAVFPFDNDAETDRQRLDFLRGWLSEAMAARIAQAGGMRVVERGELRRILDEQKLGGDLASSETRFKLGRAVGAQILLVGGFSMVLEELQIDARIVDTRSGDVLRSITVRGDTRAMRHLAGQVSDQLLSALGLRVTRPALAPGLADDRSLVAAEHYYRGVVFERAGRTDEAIDSYEKVLGLDANDVVARERLERLRDRSAEP
jgi:TolB-like protein